MLESLARGNINVKEISLELPRVSNAFDAKRQLGKDGFEKISARLNQYIEVDSTLEASRILSDIALIYPDRISEVATEHVWESVIGETSFIFDLEKSQSAGRDVYEDALFGANLAIAFPHKDVRDQAFGPRTIGGTNLSFWNECRFELENGKDDMDNYLSLSYAMAIIDREKYFEEVKPSEEDFKKMFEFTKNVEEAEDLVWHASHLRVLFPHKRDEILKSLDINFAIDYLSQLHPNSALSNALIVAADDIRFNNGLELVFTNKDLQTEEKPLLPERRKF